MHPSALSWNYQLRSFVPKQNVCMHQPCHFRIFLGSTAMFVCWYKVFIFEICFSKRSWSLSRYLKYYVFIHLCLSVCLSPCNMSVCPSVRLSVCLSVCQATWLPVSLLFWLHTDGNTSSALAMEIPQSNTEPSIYYEYIFLYILWIAIWKRRRRYSLFVS